MAARHGKQQSKGASACKSVTKLQSQRGEETHNENQV